MVDVVSKMGGTVRNVKFGFKAMKGCFVSTMGRLFFIAFRTMGDLTNTYEPTPGRMVWTDKKVRKVCA